MVVDVDGTVRVGTLEVQVRVDTALQEVVRTVTVKKEVVGDSTVIVLVSVYDVTVILVVTFEKMNVKVTGSETVVPTTDVVVVVVTAVVTGPCIGLSAGTIVGTRIPSAARVTQTTTRTLIASCLLKSVPSRCSV
jgi:hypothetical protein